MYRTTWAKKPESTTTAGPSSGCKQCASVGKLLESGRIKAKLRVSQPNDVLEQQADRVAAQIEGPESPASTTSAGCGQGCSCGTLHRKARQGDAVSPATAASVNAIRSGGTPLPAASRQHFESHLGQDFSKVRIHTDPTAQQLSQKLDARAFTYGSDIAFATGEYRPETRSGRRLIAHELVHVMQNRSGTVMRDYAVPSVNAPNDALTLTPDEQQAAIRFNQQRFFDASELALMRDVLGLAETPTTIDADFVQAVARYQQEFGMGDVDGKLGPDTARALTTELGAEGLTAEQREMAIRNRSDQSANNINSGTGNNARNGAFDATLSHRNARLTLNMRVQFNFTGAWPNQARKTTWARDYIRRVENRWSYKLLMKRKQRRSRLYLRNYATRVDVDSSTTNPHYVANVRWATSWMQSSVPAGGNVAQLDTLDENTRNLQSTHGGVTRTYQQRGVEHEFGHMLGLNHIDCDGGGNCYGGSHGSGSSGNIMGRGSAVTVANALPFQTAMKTITTLDWDAAPYRVL